MRPSLLEHIGEVQPRPIVQPVTLPTVRAAAFPVLRCSALEVLELPREAREIAVDRPLTAVEARGLVRDAGVWATVASRGRTLVAFGADRDLEQAFASVGGQLGSRGRCLQRAYYRLAQPSIRGRCDGRCSCGPRPGQSPVTTSEVLSTRVAICCYELSDGRAPLVVTQQLHAEDADILGVGG